MNTNKQVKVNVVDEISKRISESQGLVVAEYAGLSVKNIQELRKQLLAHNVELKVYKNRLFKLAAEKNGISEINSTLVGPNIFAFGMTDDISPAKVLAEFAKAHSALKLKSGTYEGKVIFADEVAKVATLPSFEEALAMLALQLISPVKFVAVGLNMIATEGHLAQDAAAPTKPQTDVVEEVKEENNVEENNIEESKGE